MFWDQTAKENTLQTLLRTPEELTLEVVLADQFVLQELRSGNDDLVKFLTQKDVLLNMLKIALDPVIPDDQPLQVHYKPSLVCSEILTIRTNDHVISAFVQCSEAVNYFVEALDKVANMNHLVAGFFAKIVTHLLHRQFSATMNMFAKAKFIDKCLDGMQYGAISDLLQNIIKVPCTSEDMNEMKEFLVRERVASRVIALLDRNQPESVHENASDLYNDMIRYLRDLLYSFDDKEDILEATLFTKDIVLEILDRMFTRDDSNALNHSIVVNCAEILLTLLETNTEMMCPSHLYGENACEGWAGGAPGGEGNQMDMSQNNVWKPDENRIVEMAVSARTCDIANAVLESLEFMASNKESEPTTAWLKLLSLLVALCNTNNSATHTAVFNGLKGANFEKILELIPKFPSCSLLHRLVEKLVLYPTLSNIGADVSPLIEFWLNDGNLINVVLRGLALDASLGRLTAISLRTFYVQMGLGIHRASCNNFAQDFLESVLLKSDDWAKIQSIILTYEEQNRKDTECGTSARSSNESTQNDFSDEHRVRASQIMHQMHTGLPHSVVDTFGDDVTDGFSETADLNITPVSSVRDQRVNFDENDIDESAFESRSEMREPRLDDFPAVHFKASSDAWPGSGTHGCGSTEDDGDEWAAFDKEMSAYNNSEIFSSDTNADWPTGNASELKSSAVCVDNANNDTWASFGSDQVQPRNESVVANCPPAPSEEENIDLALPAESLENSAAHSESSLAQLPAEDVLSDPSSESFC